MHVRHGRAEPERGCPRPGMARPGERAAYRADLAFVHHAGFGDFVRGRGRSLGDSGWRCGADWACLFDVREDGRRARLRREIVTFRRHASGWRRSEEVHVLRVLERSRVLGELRSAGLRARASRGWGAFELPPRRLAFVARKPPGG